MKKVVIVDDEALTLRHLQEVIDGFDLDLQLAGTASNNHEAFSLIKKTHADIVISDIRMGSSNGLDLCQKLSVLTPHTKTIILSGHNDFQYARRAIEYNVSEYLLKPINPDELHHVLEKVIIELDEEQLARYNQQRLQQQIGDCLPMLRDWVFSTINRYAQNPEKLQETLELFGIKLDGYHYHAIHIHLSPREEARLEKDVVEAAIIPEVLVKFIPHTFSYVYFYDANSVTFLLSGRQREMDGQPYTMAMDFRGYLSYNYPGNFSIGISNPFTQLHDIVAAAKQAQEASEYYFYIGYQQIIATRDIERTEETSRSAVTFDYASMATEIHNSMKKCDAGLAETWVEQYLETLVGTQSSIQFIINKCVELYFFLLNSMEQEFSFTKTGQEAYHMELLRARDLSEIRAVFKTYCEQTIDILATSRQDNASRLIQKAKAYINHHFAENITLESIAREIGLSSCYLSSLFRATEQVSLKEYITNTRIDHSKKLLRESDQKIYEIADQVGYVDSCYFSQLFKKATGLTPKQYREY